MSSCRSTVSKPQTFLLSTVCITMKVCCKQPWITRGNVWFSSELMRKEIEFPDPGPVLWTPVSNSKHAENVTPTHQAENIISQPKLTNVLVWSLPFWTKLKTELINTIGCNKTNYREFFGPEKTLWLHYVNLNNRS